MFGNRTNQSMNIPTRMQAPASESINPKANLCTPLQAIDVHKCWSFIGFANIRIDNWRRLGFLQIFFPHKWDYTNGTTTWFQGRDWGAHASVLNSSVPIGETGFSNWTARQDSRAWNGEMKHHCLLCTTCASLWAQKQSFSSRFQAADSTQPKSSR